MGKSQFSQMSLVCTDELHAGPPGSAAPPGSLVPPGMPQSAHPLPARPGALPPGFVAPPNMPNINFNAPVIRLGTTGPQRDAPTGGRHRDSNAEPLGGRRGVGMDRSLDQQRQQTRNDMVSYIPPTREEIARTIFVGNISEGVGGDVGVERILRTAGGLRRWTRAIDSRGTPCKFGFAEFDDAQSLETAAAVLKEVVIPVKRPQLKTKKSANGEAKSGTQTEQNDADTVEKEPGANTDGEGAEVGIKNATAEDEEEEVEKTTLLVCFVIIFYHFDSNTSSRSLSMKHLSSTQKTGVNAVVKLPMTYSSVSTPPKTPLMKC
jgi:hypothetical protein